MGQNLLDDAIVEFEEVLRMNPQNPFAHYHIGNILSRQGHIDEAYAKYQKAIELNPWDSCSHFNIGKILSKKGQADQAIAEYIKSIKLSPDNYLHTITWVWNIREKACEIKLLSSIILRMI